jgi:putative proteasome-type protease
MAGGSMTYCIGILVKDGLVMMGDTRTNEGIDHISSFRKLHLFEEPGHHALALATAGSLSVTQSVMTFLNEGLPNSETGKIDTLANQPSMFHAAQLVGRAMREVYRIDGKAMEKNGLNFDANILLGGQIKGGNMHLYSIYAAGHFIEVTPETAYMQIGEHKYGKPILDRSIRHDTPPYEALKSGLLSMDATIRSNLSVGLPIDLAVLPRDAMRFETIDRIEDEDPYFEDLCKQWAKVIQKGRDAIPTPPYGGKATKRLSNVVNLLRPTPPE